MNALILLAVLAVVTLFTGLFLKRPSVVRGVAITGLVGVIAASIAELRGCSFFPVNIEGMLRFTPFSLLIISIILILTLIYFVVAAKDMEKVGSDYAEYFSLIFFVLCGAVLTVSFQSLLILFLGIEILSIPLYVLTGAEKKNLKSNEASLKYFLMGAFSTGILLMGITLIYGATGTFDVSKMNLLSAGTEGIVAQPGMLSIAGMLLLLFAMTFKVSAAPFHFWAPDVYDGAPTVFTSFMATIVKGVAFVGFIKLFHEAFGSMKEQWHLWITVITVITLFVGNITAVFQQSVKRMLAYSSIAQAGFMLFALYGMSDIAMEGLVLYVAGYSLATIGIFAVLNRVKDHSYAGFAGLAKQQPFVAVMMVIFMLSLAGIPLTIGFLAKLFMLQAALKTGGLGIVIFAVIMAAVSAYYYFKVIRAMYFKEGTTTIETGKGFKVSLLVIAVLIVLLGLFPQLLLNWMYF